MELGETQINSVWSIDLLWCVNRELDKTASSVSDAVLPLSLGNLGLLIADPTIDKTSLHSQIMHTYKWSARVSSLLCQLTSLPLSHSVDNIWAMMIVWRIQDWTVLYYVRQLCAVICTVVYCVVFCTVTHFSSCISPAECEFATDSLLTTVLNWGSWICSCRVYLTGVSVVGSWICSGCMYLTDVSVIGSWICSCHVYITGVSVVGSWICSCRVYITGVSVVGSWICSCCMYITTCSCTKALIKWLVDINASQATGSLHHQ